MFKKIKLANKLGTKGCTPLADGKITNGYFISSRAIKDLGGPDKAYKIVHRVGGVKYVAIYTGIIAVGAATAKVVTPLINPKNCNKVFDNKLNKNMKLLGQALFFMDKVSSYFEDKEQDEQD